MSEIYQAWLVAEDTVLTVDYPGHFDLENVRDDMQESLTRWGIAFVDPGFVVGNKDVALDFATSKRDYDLSREALEWYSENRPEHDSELCGGFENDIQAFENAVENFSGYAMWQGLTNGDSFAFNYVVDLDQCRTETGNKNLTRANAKAELGAWLDEIARLYAGYFSVVRWCSVEDLVSEWGEDWRDNLQDAMDLVSECNRIESTEWIGDPVKFLNGVGAGLGKRVTVEELSA